MLIKEYEIHALSEKDYVTHSILSNTLPLGEAAWFIIDSLPPDDPIIENEWLTGDVFKKLEDMSVGQSREICEYLVECVETFVEDMSPFEYSESTDEEENNE